MSASREKLPNDRESLTRRFAIKYPDEHTGEMHELKFYVTAGMYADGRLGEVFIRGDKVGGLIGGALDALAMAMSVALQHGTPLLALTKQLRSHRFGPSGRTGDAMFRTCTSMFDLTAQWLEYMFPDGVKRVGSKTQAQEVSADDGPK